MRRPIVISGIGTVSAFGVGPKALWDGLVSGASCIRPATRLDASGFDCQLAAEVVGEGGAEFSAREYVPKSYRKATKVMARDIEIAVACAHTAAADARLITRATEAATPTYAGERIGCQIGAGLIAAESDELAAALSTAVAENPDAASKARGGFDYRAWGTVPMDGQKTGGMENLPPLWMLKYLPNMLACHVTIIHGAEGPSNTHTCTEASGLLSIGEGCRVIERGSADACFSGSAESKLNLMGMLRLTAAQRLARAPADAAVADVCRPYDPASTGSIPGEGGGIVILEDAALARKRSANVYAEVAGFGAAHSTTNLLPPFHAAPGAVNHGLANAIRAALRDAGVTPDAIDAVFPQACGCPFFDLPEAGALREVFGTHLPSIDIVPLVTTLGDCFAGSGGLQTAAAALSIRNQALPAKRVRLSHTPHTPSPNTTQTPPTVQNAPEGEGRKNVRCVLVCSTSVGGQNAALVVRQAQ
ncbi:MAG: beta-ketoacyl synthase N-terminal-like domain-containing protein [Phycisphaerales bacterium]